METAGKLVDDEELREAMKESGIGTPATRAAIIERLITVGYVERDARALVATEKGLNVIRLLDAHMLTSPELTGSWEHRLGKIERGEDSREKFMSDIAGFAERDGAQARRDAQRREHPAREARAVPGVRARDQREPQGLLVLGARGPGLRLRHLEVKAGKTLPVRIARELIKTGYTERAVTGFRGRSGRSFRAHLAMQQTDEGKWRVEFDEEWAKEGAKAPEAEAEADDELTSAEAPGKKNRGRPAQRRVGLRGLLAAFDAWSRSACRARARGWAAVPIALITGPANAGKAEVVMDAVRGHLAHGSEPLLVVPTRADVEHYRRELAGAGAMLGARVERFEGLIGELVSRAGGGEPLLGGLARERALAAIAGADCQAPGYGFVRARGPVAELQVAAVRRRGWWRH